MHGADHRARIIAASNILSSLHDRGSVIVGVLLGAGLTIPQVFLVIGVLNAIVAFYIFMLVPEYLIRFVAFVVTRIVYRFKVRGDEKIPTEGPAILVCNHVSFVDPVLLMAASPRPIRFIMDHEIFKTPVLGWFFRLAKAIPIAPQKVDAQIYEQAFVRAKGVLDDGDLFCIFPEGAISRDGAMGEFKGGVMRLLESNPVPVVPLALQNLWGSFFSRADGRAMSKPFRRGIFSRVGLVAGDPVPPAAVSPAGLRDRVGALLAS
jgi:1-acyl-sn-glycerol-3-phosphate acyltransferase